MDAEGTLNEAEQLVREGQTSRALTLADSVLEHSPPLQIWHRCRAHKLRSLAMWHDGRRDEAVVEMRRAVDLQPTYATGHYNLAAFAAHRGDKAELLARLAQAITHGAKQYVMDYRPIIRDDPDFDGFRSDPDFQALVDTLPKDPTLRSVYQHLQDDEPYEAWKRGAEVLEQAADRLAVLQAMEAALESICSDLDEHGEVNLQLYGAGAHSVEFFTQSLSDVQRRLKEARAAGQRSTVFRTFRPD